MEDSLLAAVVAPWATDTDALSTALLVLGSGGLISLAARFSEAGFLIAEREPVNRSGNGNGPEGMRVSKKGGPWESRFPAQERVP